MATEEQLELRIEAAKKTITKYYILVLLILALNITTILITVFGLGYTQDKFAENPLFELQAKYVQLSNDSRQLNSDYSSKIAEFKAEAALKNLKNQEDPTQLLIRDLIYLERDFQEFILYSNLGLQDLVKIIGGIDEWYFFQKTKFRKLVTNSRKRQKGLRGLLQKRKQKALPLK
jgi:hypothetical protein